MRELTNGNSTVKANTIEPFGFGQGDQKLFYYFIDKSSDEFSVFS